MSDHYAAAESAANAGQWTAAIAFAVLALVDEFREETR